MKITNVKSAIIGSNLVLRIMTDKGIDGYAETENGKEFLQPLVPYFRDLIVGCDPTDVAGVMWRIRRGGGFKPWGKLVSTIEIALWDITGKEYGIPVYKLLGGKVRDRVRVYNGSFQDPNPPCPNPTTPEEFAENVLALHERPEGLQYLPRQPAAELGVQPRQPAQGSGAGLFCGLCRPCACGGQAQGGHGLRCRPGSDGGGHPEDRQG